MFPLFPTRSYASEPGELARFQAVELCAEVDESRPDESAVPTVVAMGLDIACGVNRRTDGRSP